MNCPLATQEGSALLLAYSSDRLDAESAVGVRRHVEACAACREFVEGQNAVWQALDLWTPEPVSADFDRRLYQRIEQQVSWWDKVLAPFRPLLAHRGLPIAAAAGMVLLAGVLLDRHATVPRVPAPVSAEVEVMQPDQVQHALDEVEMLNRFNRLMRSDAADSNAKM